MPAELPASRPGPPAAAIVFFDRFELRPADRLLLRDGAPVALRAKALDLLTVLVERAGHLVTKGELLDVVWPGLVVEENNIASQIAALLKVLGGGLVATVPGSGYRFVAEVRRAAPGGPQEARMETASALTSPSPSVSPSVSPAPPLPPGPPAQRLFGRADDLRAVRAALDQGGGCVTLAGPGGVGKTVLARAAMAARPARQRCAWIDLASLADAAQVPGALCRSLGIGTPASPEALADALVAALGEGEWLLVLDNAEHVVDGVAALCAVLAAALPAVAVLVTSQLPLRIAGERVHALEPLAWPAAGVPEEEALASAAVQLLLDRIRAVDARLSLGADALPLLRSLCARLDGMPLAIEMAASMVPLLGLGGVAVALDQRLRVLRSGRREAPARHKTLRAALEWSHGLLAPAQQRALRRVAVFADSFSLDLAVAVTVEAGEDRWEAVDTFAALVERSLVASLHADPPRYRLLETVRSFALEALDAAGGDEGGATRLRAVLALTDAVRPAVAGAGASATAAAELANVPEALRWALAHDAPAAVELALAAAAAATWTPWLGEAGRWVEACEPVLGAGLSPAQQAAWWRELARFQTFVRGSRTVEAACTAAAIERSLGNDEGLFWSLVPLLRSRVAEPAEFEACRAEAQALLDAHPAWPARARAVFSGSLALEYRRRGDFEAALAHQQAEAVQARAAGLHAMARNAEGNVAATLVGLGRHEAALAMLDARAASSADSEDAVVAHDRLQRLNALLGLQRLDEAEASAPSALDWCRRFDVLDIEQVLACLQVRRGRAAVAAQILGHYRQSLVRRGAELPADDHAPWRTAQRLVVDAIGEPAMQALMAQGALLDTAAADALLLDRSATTASA